MTPTLASVAIVMIAGACGSGSSDGGGAAATPATDVTASAPASTSQPATTIAATTTSSAPTTAAPTTAAPTTAEPTTTAIEQGAVNLASLTLSLDDLGEGYQQPFEGVDFTNSEEFFLRPCGEELRPDGTLVFRAGSGYVYPVAELGWPPEGVLYDIVATAHQTPNASEIVAAAEDAAANCASLFPFDSGDGVQHEGAIMPLDVATIEGVEGTGYVIGTLTDSNTYLEFTLGVEDVALTLLMIGAAPEVESLEALARPLVEKAQRDLAECMATPACRDVS